MCIRDRLPAGFLGGGYDFTPGCKQIDALALILEAARGNLSLAPGDTLPVGVGFITFQSSGFAETVVPLVARHRPAAVWLFAPNEPGQHAPLVAALRAAGAPWRLRVFVQVGTVSAAREAVEDGADVVVAQGVDAGGHQWARGAGVVALVPDVVDMLAREFPARDVAVLAAGGVVDGRGVAACMALGAAGAVMGTRFVATDECPMPDAVKATIVRTADGAASTVKSVVHDDIQGTGFWPALYDGRAIVGESYRDHEAGVGLDDNITKYKAAMTAGQSSRRTVWA